ncbi:MAG: hypothetical protein DWQ01_12095 [Planctomycetota bacterium]|nr:MAG: hypothetical protein DWQ01_12095 [Planctomycetota bacterium]
MAARPRRFQFQALGLAHKLPLVSAAAAGMLCFLPDLAALPLPQRGVPPWSQLEPMIAEADFIALGKVEETRYLAPLGHRISVRLEEVLWPPLHNPNPKRWRPVHYLTDSKKVVLPGDRELLFLAKPAKDGLHHQLLHKVGARDLHQEPKVAWLRQVLKHRQAPKDRQARLFVAFYGRSLWAEAVWTRNQALAEIERLRRQRGPELHTLLAISDLQKALKLYPDGPMHLRLQAILDWRQKPLPKPDRPPPKPEDGS